MFYSRTLLARKSALGTVWVAAHLERRLRRPQIDGIDIPSYADCIMVPEVPIALRLSAHLLLGLVRIYSWKVDYIYQDCNRMKVHVRAAAAPASVQLCLAPEADKAPFEAVTLPERFELDVFDLGVDLSQPVEQSIHSSPREQITLPERDLVPMDEYIAIYVDETDTPNRMPTGLVLEDGFPRMEGPSEQIDVPFTHTTGGVDFMAVDQTDDVSAHSMQNKDTLSGASLEIEVIRAAVHNPESEISPLLSGPEYDLREPVIDRPGDGINGENGIPTVFGDIGTFEGSIPLDLSFSGHGPSSSQIHQLRRRSPRLATMEDIATPEMSPLVLKDQHFPELQPSPVEKLQPSPVEKPQPSPAEKPQPSPVEKPKGRMKKRKQLFDELLVLSNVDMKQQLEDASKLIRKRPKLPCANLDIWRYRRRQMKEIIFNEHLFSGITSSLRDVYHRENALLIPDEEYSEIEVPRLNIQNNEVRNDLFSPGGDSHASPDNNATHERMDIDNENMQKTPEPRCRTEQAPPVLETDQSLEHQLFDGETHGSLLSPFNVETLLQTAATERSPLKTNHSLEQQQPFFDGGTHGIFPSPVNVQTLKQTAATVIDTEIPPTTTEMPLSECSDEGGHDFGFGLLNSTSRELDFLEIYGESSGESYNPLVNINSAGGSRAATSDVLSTRTRAVDKYLQEQFSASRINNQFEKLSLNKTLEGKTRRQCAQMFFEITVLKTHGYINVEQDEPYLDIKISLPQNKL